MQLFWIIIHLIIYLLAIPLLIITYRVLLSWIATRMGGVGDVLQVLTMLLVFTCVGITALLGLLEDNTKY